MNVKRTVLVVSIIEVIAIIVIIVYDILGTTVVSNDDHVPGSQESYKEPRDDPSGTSTPPTPAVSPSHDAMQCRVEDGAPQRRTGRTPMAIPCQLIDFGTLHPSATLQLTMRDLAWE